MSPLGTSMSLRVKCSGYDSSGRNRRLGTASACGGTGRDEVADISVLQMNMGVESILCIALCGSFLEYSQRNSQLHCEQFANEKACDPDGLISVARAYLASYRLYLLLVSVLCSSRMIYVKSLPLG